MTGDIAQWNKDGTLSVIDRKKNLVKLAGGEYIALERLESVSPFSCRFFGRLQSADGKEFKPPHRSLYGSCEYVARIMVHADSAANKPMAVSWRRCFSRSSPSVKLTTYTIRRFRSSSRTKQT